MAKSWEQLIGGYATNTLTEEEKRQLFKAALEDQTLFDALADEEALKALLADPDARQRILESLQALGNPQQSAETYGSGLHWLRRPSSLAWAGSIAALGLVLIFGWQMEREWGFMAKQDQEAKRVASMDNENKPVQSQSSGIAKEKASAPDVAQESNKTPDKLAAEPAPPPKVEEPVIAKASKDIERKKVASPKPSLQREIRQNIKKEQRAKEKKPMTPSPESDHVQNIIKESQSLPSSVGKKRAEEDHFQSLSQAPTFSDQRRKEDARSSAREKEFFYRQENKRAAPPAEERGGKRAQELLDGTRSGEEGVLEHSAAVVQGAPEANQGVAVKSRRGIRYRFERRTQQEGSDQTIDQEPMSSYWQDIQLIIEFNTREHLYVLISLEQGKWRFLKPEASNLPESPDGAIMVRFGESVRFPLKQLPDPREGQAVSPIVVLLSSAPLSDLGTWLTIEKGHEATIEQFRGARPHEYVVIGRSVNPDQPFRVEIPLPQLQ